MLCQPEDQHQRTFRHGSAGAGGRRLRRPTSEAELVMLTGVPKGDPVSG
jgi:hypothetical protein